MRKQPWYGRPAVLGMCMKKSMRRGPLAAGFGMADRFLMNSSVRASHSAADLWCLRCCLLLLGAPFSIESEATGPVSAAQATSRHRTMRALRLIIASAVLLAPAGWHVVTAWSKEAAGAEFLTAASDLHLLSMNGWH